MNKCLWTDVYGRTSVYEKGRTDRTRQKGRTDGWTDIDGRRTKSDEQTLTDIGRTLTDVRRKLIDVRRNYDEW
jgi:hypothetical protein